MKIRLNHYHYCGRIGANFHQLSDKGKKDKDEKGNTKYQSSNDTG
jgi:hypothetical protein